jgi:phytoene/squalene synthetase
MARVMTSGMVKTLKMIEKNNFFISFFFMKWAIRSQVLSLYLFFLKIDINMDAVQRLNGSWHYIYIYIYYA